MLDKNMREAIEQEWRSGVLLNPFKIIDEAVMAIKDSTTKNKPKHALPICREVSKLFLDCTDYLFIYQDDEVRNTEEHFLTAMFLYLYTKAPADEQCLCMVCELILADEPSNNNEYGQSDLDRLFVLLEDKDEKHHALNQYKTYQKSPVRVDALRCIEKRFRPLIAIASSAEDSVFDECSKYELFELAAALVHDCAGFPKEPQAIYAMVNEIVFVTVALAYMMMRIDVENQDRNKLFEILAQPQVYTAKITSELKAQPPDALPGLQDIINYWYKHSEKAVAAGNFNKKLVNGARKFFTEFK